jgi:hypothetical protein
MVAETTRGRAPSQPPQPLTTTGSEIAPAPPVTTNTQRPLTGSRTSMSKKANPISAPAAASGSSHPMCCGSSSVGGLISTSTRPTGLSVSACVSTTSTNWADRSGPSANLDSTPPDTLSLLSATEAASARKAPVITLPKLPPRRPSTTVEAQISNQDARRQRSTPVHSQRHSTGVTRHRLDVAEITWLTVILVLSGNQAPSHRRRLNYALRDNRKYHGPLRHHRRTRRGSPPVRAPHICCAGAGAGARLWRYRGRKGEAALALSMLLQAPAAARLVHFGRN